MSHLSREQIVRAIDDELLPGERVQVEGHLAGCDGCRVLYRELGALSVHIEDAVQTAPVAVKLDARMVLEEILRAREKTVSAGGGNRMWRWAMGVAAAVACATVLLTHRQAPIAAPDKGVEVMASTPATFELDGETFVALPYSNPELPVSSSRIVEMEVPVSSLRDAGVLDAPSSESVGDRSVLADVLLGADGQPRGVHVLSEL